MRRAWLLVPLAAALLVPACSRTRPPISAANEYFRVIVDYEDDRLPAPALAALDGVWEAVAELWGVPPVPPEKPLDVYLYFHEGGYDEADARLNAGNRAENRAFAHPGTMTAHVDVQPRFDAALIAEHGLPPQTERMLAHEAAHLARYALVPGYEKHPKWLANGTAIEVAGRVMHDRGRDGQLGSTPFTATLLWWTKNMDAEGVSPPLSRVLVDDLDAVDGRPLIHPGSYAVQCAAWAFLRARHDEALRWFLRRMSHDPWTVVKAEPLRDEFVKKAGRTASELDLEFSTWLREWRSGPVEYERGLAVGGTAWQQCAFESAAALAWCATAPAESYEMIGAVSFVTKAETAAEIRLSRVGATRAIVRFQLLPDGRRTRVSIRNGMSGDEFVHALVDTRRRLLFRIDVAPDRVTVTIDDEEPLIAHCSVPRNEDWGLSVSAGGWCIWHDISIER